MALVAQQPATAGNDVSEAASIPSTPILNSTTGRAGVQALEESAPGLPALSLSAGRGETLVDGAASPSQIHTAVASSRVSISDVIGSLGHALRSFASSEYRHAMARQEHLETLRNSTDDSAKIAAVNALGSLVKAGEGKTITVGASVNEAVTELKLVAEKSENSWQLRAQAMHSLAKHFSTEGKLESGFARELARALIGEKKTEISLVLANMLSSSRDPFVQEVLLETLKDERTIIAKEAGTSLRASLGSRPSGEMEQKLLNKISGAEFVDKRQHVYERVAALVALSGHQSEAYLSSAAQIIADPKESPQLRFKALELCGNSQNRQIRSAILELCCQDGPSDWSPSLVNLARQLAGRRDPGIAIKTERGHKIILGDFSRS